MTGLRTWWRKLGGLMAVCLLATLIGGPTLDAIVCKGEGEVSVASAQFELGQSLATPDGDRSDPGHDGIEVCAHGHCHHGLALGLVLAETAIEPAPVTDLHDLTPASPHASRAPAGLERPPRA